MQFKYPTGSLIRHNFSQAIFLIVKQWWAERSNAPGHIFTKANLLCLHTGSSSWPVDNGNKLLFPRVGIMYSDIRLHTGESYDFELVSSG